MGSRLADAMGKCLEALADSDNKCIFNGRAVDPLSPQILRLQAGVRGHLEEVGGEHGVLVGPDALGRVEGGGEGGSIGVFDDFELVLLVGVEETVEGVGGEGEGGGD